MNPRSKARAGIVALAPFLIAAAGCGNAGKPAATLVPGASGSVGDVKQIVDDNAGTIYALTDRALFRLENDALASVAALPKANPASAAAAFDPTNSQQAVLAEVDDTAATVNVYTSPDAGRTWVLRTSRPFASLSQLGIGDVDAALIAGRIVVLSNEMTGSNSSSAVALSSVDGGATWTTRAVPVGGSVTNAGGAFWVTGGVQLNDVYVSPDGLAWTRVTPSAASAEAQFTRPKTTGAGSVAIASSTPDPNAGTRLNIWTTGDSGVTWQNADSAAIAEAAGRPAYVAMTSTRWVAAPEAGSRIYSHAISGSGDPDVISPNGLPSVEGLAFVSATSGAALSVETTCPTGKASCASAGSVYITSDGGQTWTLSA